MTPDVNEGLINQGTISGQSIAVGRGARAETTIEAAADALEARGQADVAQRLEDLRAQLVSQSEAIERFDETMQTFEMMAARLAEPEPNRLAIRSLLDGIAASVRSVGGVAEAVGALKLALGGLL